MPVPTLQPVFEDDLIADLTAGGFGAIGVSIFRTKLPDSPAGAVDNCIAVTPIGGPGATSDASGSILEAADRVLVRNTDFETGLKTANAIIARYRPPAGNRLNWAHYFVLRISPSPQNPAILDQDQRRRYLFSLTLSSQFYLKG